MVVELTSLSIPTIPVEGPGTQGSPSQLDASRWHRKAHSFFDPSARPPYNDGSLLGGVPLEHEVPVRRVSAALALVLVLSCGCNDRKHEQLILKMERLKSEISQLKSASTNNAVVMGDVQNKMMLLEDQVDSNRVMLTRVRMPRPQLPVVKLTRNGHHPPPPREELKPITMDDVAVMNWGAAAPQVGLEMTTAEVAPPEPRKERKPFDSRPIELYKHAFGMLKDKRHAEAVLAFERFLEQYSEHDYADNALYWLGETYYDTQDYKKALQYFGKVIRLYPEGNKVPDAILKSALSHNNVGDVPAARDMMNHLLAHYPGTRAAGIARKKLAELH